MDIGANSSLPVNWRKQGGNAWSRDKAEMERSHSLSLKPTMLTEGESEWHDAALKKSVSGESNPILMR